MIQSQPVWACAEDVLSDSDGDAVKVTPDDASISFYGSVTQKSIAKLVTELRKAEVRSLTVAAQMGIDPPAIRLHIHSYGGNLHAGLGAYDVIRSLRVPVHTYIEGVAASAGTIISVAGEKRYMTRHSAMLIHQLSTGFWGKYEELQDLSKNADLNMAQIRSVYKERCHIPGDVLDEILKHDLYWDAETCLKYGLVDEIR